VEVQERGRVVVRPFLFGDTGSSILASSFQLLPGFF
jgi:hypothetical protein